MTVLNLAKAYNKIYGPLFDAGHKNGEMGSQN